MPDELFQNLSAQDREEALLVAAGQIGRPAYLLEKDFWIVWTLSALCSAPFGKNLTLKGGTSLSKAYNAISRFSEDLDIVYDIRAIAQDFTDKNKGSPIPPTRSQARRWTEEIRKRLPKWIDDQVLPAIKEGLHSGGLCASARTENEKLLITYQPLFTDYGFVKPEILVEFGARATGEPRKKTFHPLRRRALPDGYSFSVGSTIRDAGRADLLGRRQRLSTYFAASRTRGGSASPGTGMT